MTFDEALDELTALHRGSYVPYVDAEKSRIEILYREVLGKTIRQCNCKDKYHDAVIETLCYLKRHGKMKEKPNYILRPGVLLHHTDGNAYTNDNLTDEIAAEFLKNSPKAAWMFEVMPSETIHSKKEEDTPPEETAESKELQALRTRVAELEAANAELEAKNSELAAAIPSLESPAPEMLDDADKIEDMEGEGAEESGEVGDEGSADDKAVEINDKIKAIIAAKLTEGKSKAAIKTSFSGKTIDGVKLTHKLVAIYIKAIETEAGK